MGINPILLQTLRRALLPPLQGLVADWTHNLQLSFIVPLLAYAYVAFYGWKGHRINRKELAS